MNRIAIFSHYNANNIIDDYVVYFLSELNKVVDNIIFVSDCTDLPSRETIKVHDYISHLIVENHGEYDFGSYKKGYLYLKNIGLLTNCDELIFVNDSCYAPLFPFEDMFNIMSYRNLDFWGNTENSVIFNHIQSYFLVFKKQVFTSEIFSCFMNSIQKEPSKDDIIHKYEIGLTKLLSDNNFKYDVYCEVSKKYPNSHTYKTIDLIKKDKSPFYKRSLPLLKTELYPINLKYFIKKYSKYEYSLIEKDIKNNRCN